MDIVLPNLIKNMAGIKCNDPYCDITVVPTRLTKRNNEVIYFQHVHM